MLSLLFFLFTFFSPFAIQTYTTFVKLILYFSNNGWFFSLVSLLPFPFLLKNVSKLLSFIHYLYIFTFALVLCNIAYLNSTNQSFFAFKPLFAEIGVKECSVYLAGKKSLCRWIIVLVESLPQTALPGLTTLSSPSASP